MALCQQGNHLFDLNDLLGGAAEEAEQRLAEGLAQNAQAGKRGEAGGEMGVTAPRERIGQFARVAGRVEIVGDRGSGDRDQRVGGRPMELAMEPRRPRRGSLRTRRGRRVSIRRTERETDEVRAEDAVPDAGVTAPAEGLAAVERFGEHGGVERGAEWQRTPRAPTRGRGGEGRGGYLAGFSQRKLFCTPSRRPSVVTTSIFQATGCTFGPTQSAPVRPRL